MIYLCSDWHLGHDKLVELAHRPHHFNDLIDKGLREQPWERGDTLLNLGDVYLGREGDGLARIITMWLYDIGVNTVLVQGNHDSKRLNRLLGMGWSWVCESTTLTYHGKRLLLTHEAVETFDGDLNIHGHLHQIDGHRGGLIRDGRHILLSCELMDYRPITLDRLLDIGATPKWENGKFVAAEQCAPVISTADSLTFNQEVVGSSPTRSTKSVALEQDRWLNEG